MMTVEIETAGELELGKPRLLFERPLALRLDDDPRDLTRYDVAPDGQSFVMIEQSGSGPVPTQLNLVQNWGEELKRLVPPEK